MAENDLPDYGRRHAKILDFPPRFQLPPRHTRRIVFIGALFDCHAALPLMCYCFREARFGE